MRGITSRAWLLIYLATALAACDTTPEERAATACSALCACEQAPLPGIQNQCVSMCTSQIGGLGISDACVSCISDHANQCTTIETDCQNVCQQNQPPPPEFPDGGVVVVVDSF